MFTIGENNIWWIRAGDDEVLRSNYSTAPFNFYFELVSVEDPKQIAKSTNVRDAWVPKGDYNDSILPTVSLPPF